MSHTQFYRELIELSAQEDRLSLIHRLVQALHRINRAHRTAFFDVLRERQFDRATGFEITKSYLIDPLDHAAQQRPLNTEKGSLDAIEQKKPQLIELDEPVGLTRIIFPIRVGGQVVNLLIQDAFIFSAEAKGFIRIIGDIFANLQHLIAIKDQDPLTGLLNRRSFDDIISKILDAQPSGSQLSRDLGDSACLAVFDIDHFKKINDQHGHAIGDEVLILFARLMGEMLRHNDIIFRFGGEEFLAILTNVTEEKAQAALERFRAALEAHDFPQVHIVTVSIGFVMINGDDFPPVLIEKADKALYYAKENGRNQVHQYERLVEAGLLENSEHETEDIELWG